MLVWIAIGLLMATPTSRLWPVEVSLTATSGTTVCVAWRSNDEHHYGCSNTIPVPYDSFELLFQQVGETAWTTLGHSTDTFMLHDPKGHTGRYSVRGWRGIETSWEPDMYGATTVPRHIGPFGLREASSGDTSALGFSYDAMRSLSGYTYTMDTNTLWMSPDAYLSDFRPGRSGDLLLLSPSLAPDDPGVTVHDHGSWRDNSFSSPMADEQDTLPVWEPFTWSPVCSLPRSPLLVACRRHNGSYYALLKVLSVAGDSIRIEAWFQEVQTLRLIEH